MPYGCSCWRTTLLVERDCLSSIFAVHNTIREQDSGRDRAYIDRVWLLLLPAMLNIYHTVTKHYTKFLSIEEKLTFEIICYRKKILLTTVKFPHKLRVTIPIYNMCVCVCVCYFLMIFSSNNQDYISSRTILLIIYIIRSVFVIFHYKLNDEN